MDHADLTSWQDCTTFKEKQNTFVFYLYVNRLNMEYFYLFSVYVFLERNQLFASFNVTLVLDSVVCSNVGPVLFCI